MAITRRTLHSKAKHALALSQSQAEPGAAALKLLEADVAAQARVLKRAQDKVKDERAKLDALVACSVSSKPERVDWYDHAGALGGRNRERLLKAAGLSSVALHRTMERFRDGRKPTR
jgi:hypothetical protein